VILFGSALCSLQWSPPIEKKEQVAKKTKNHQKEKKEEAKTGLRKERKKKKE